VIYFCRLADQGIESMVDDRVFRDAVGTKGAAVRDRAVLIISVIVISAALTPAIAGSIKDAQSALDNGDYVTAMDLARPLAQRGDAAAQRILGQMYEQGAGAFRDLTRAGAWYRKSAEQGDAAAEQALGALYLAGQGVPRDPVLGLKWITKAADQGDIQAMASLANYYRGGFVPADPAQELRWTRKAAIKGDVRSQSGLCLVYLSGTLGQPQNPSEAFHWCKLAAEQGDFNSQIHLGDLFAVGEGVAQDKAQALGWYRKAAAAPPLVANRMFTQRTINSLQDLRETEVHQAVSRLESGLAPLLLPPLVDSRKLRARAEHGDPQAQNDLAALYTRGRSGVPEDNSQAAAWYRKAADQQFGPASYNLAYLYLGAHGVPKDYDQFLAWLHKAAEQGYAPAQVALARVLLDGFHTPKDPDQAVLWYRKAADLGDGQAQFSLGAMYEQGELVPKDLAQALAWYQKAAAQKGFAQDDAKQALERLQGTAKP
jgi:uncharacterized protein